MASYTINASLSTISGNDYGESVLDYSKASTGSSYYSGDTVGLLKFDVSGKDLSALKSATIRITKYDGNQATVALKQWAHSVNYYTSAVSRVGDVVLGSMISGTTYNLNTSSVKNALLNNTLYFCIYNKGNTHWSGTDTYDKVYYVSDGPLNIRERRDKNSYAVGNMGNGERFYAAKQQYGDYLYYENNADWLKVYYPSTGTYGYVMAKYVSVDSGTADPSYSISSAALVLQIADTTPSISVSGSFNPGSTVTISASPASGLTVSSYTYFVNGSAISNGTGTIQSVSYQISSNYIASGSITPKDIEFSVTVNYTIGSGTARTVKSVTRPGNASCTLSSIAVTDLAPAISGVYLQNRSRFRITASGATGSYNSSIVKYEFFMDGELVSSQGSATYDMPAPVSKTGTVTFSVTVTDAYGNSANASAQRTVIAYTSPTVSLTSAKRFDPSTNKQHYKGTVIKISGSYSYNTLNGSNTCTAKAYYKVKGSTANFTASSTTIPASFDNLQIASGLNGEASYIIRLEVSDKINTSSYETEVSSGGTLISFHNSGTGVAIGKNADTANKFQVNYDTKIIGHGLEVGGSVSCTSLTVNGKTPLTDNPMPTGGTSNQVLAKKSNTDRDFQWINQPTGLPSGGSDGQYLQKTSSGYQWATVNIPSSGPQYHFTAYGSSWKPSDSTGKIGDIWFDFDSYAGYLYIYLKAGIRSQDNQQWKLIHVG